MVSNVICPTNANGVVGRKVEEDTAQIRVNELNARVKMQARYLFLVACQMAGLGWVG